jgi:hypothetical protein
MIRWVLDTAYALIVAIVQLLMGSTIPILEEREKTTVVRGTFNNAT